MDMAIIFESAFNVSYLIGIFALVIIMYSRHKRGHSRDPKVTGLFILAFLLLALGDTGHVGFRVIGFLNGGLEANAALVGIGRLATSFTVTLFYMLLSEILYVRTHRKRDFLYMMIMILGFLRLIFIFLPGNEWFTTGSPLAFSYGRNAFLTAMGLVIAFQYLRAGSKGDDIFLKKTAMWVFVSYAFYLPVILFVHAVPVLGMLMIPKTLAYMAIALMGNRLFFNKAD